MVATFNAQSRLPQGEDQLKLCLSEKSLSVQTRSGRTEGHLDFLQLANAFSSLYPGNSQEEFLLDVGLPAVSKLEKVQDA